MKTLHDAYINMSNWGKILLFTTILFSVIMYFKQEPREGFNKAVEYKTKNGEVYDTFYSNIYDLLVFDGNKNDFEISSIIKETSPLTNAKLLDIGCGTGHHVNTLNNNGVQSIGVDYSKAMIKKSKEQYPNNTYIYGNVTTPDIFKPNSFSHISCMYFSFYYIKDKSQLLNNCYTWLKPGGYLIIHLVNRKSFDPILPPSNPLTILTPQRYSKERITRSKIVFDDFRYEANFTISPKNSTNVQFIEKFKDPTTNKLFRQQTHKMYMESIPKILELVRGAGFNLQKKIDLVKIGYEYQYLYIFKKA